MGRWIHIIFIITMAQKLTILFTILLVVIAAHDNSFYSTKIHVMAQDVVLPTVTKLFQQHADPICNKPCKTHDDCSGAWFCQACWNSARTCGPYVGGAMAIGL
nr:metallocarboxypeptidase inhibitor IIa precursor [Solanum tuberosum]AAC95130.1 metallocarboxypeptidase inhibitor IIa precursor [Solanum tuberosum]